MAITKAEIGEALIDITHALQSIGTSLDRTRQVCQTLIDDPTIRDEPVALERLRKTEQQLALAQRAIEVARNL
jgi:hypothetical protein